MIDSQVNGRADVRCSIAVVVLGRLELEPLLGDLGSRVEVVE